MPRVRIAIIAIRRPSGLWFVHRRRQDKTVFPGMWALGAGGRIEIGESDFDGAQRELREETGLEMEPERIASFAFKNSGVDYDVFLFSVTTNAVVLHDASEWTESGWCTSDELVEIEGTGLLCPDNAKCFRLLLQHALDR